MTKLNDAAALKSGATAVVRAYLGSTLVFGTAPGGGGWSEVAGVGSGGETGTATVAKADLTGLADGDLVVVALCGYGTDVLWSAAESGWTVHDPVGTIAGADCSSAFASKVMTDVASEPASWTFTIAGGTEVAAAAGAFRGGAGTVDAAAVSTTGQNDGTPPGQDITTDTGGALVVTMRALANQNVAVGHVPGPPAGFTTAAFHSQETPNDTATAELAWREQATAGTVTVGDWGGTDETVSEWHVRSIAFA